MTVKELTELLSEMPEDAEVHVLAEDMCGSSFLDIFEVSRKRDNVEIYTYHID